MNRNAVTTSPHAAEGSDRTQSPESKSAGRRLGKKTGSFLLGKSIRKAHRKGLVATSIGVAAAVSLMVLPQQAEAATVTSLASLPGFGCTASGNGTGGVISMTKILVNLAGDAPAYLPVEYVETGAFVEWSSGNGVWKIIGDMLTPEGFQTNGYQNTSLQEGLNAEVWHQNITGHGYFAIIVDWTGQIDGGVTHQLLAQENYNQNGSPKTYINQNVCKF